MRICGYHGQFLCFECYENELCPAAFGKIPVIIPSPMPETALAFIESYARDKDQVELFRIDKP